VAKLPLLTAAGLAVLVLAGCGAASEHSLVKSRSCLEQAGVRITRPTGDFVATTATIGSFRAHLHGKKGNFVTLSFGADEQESADTSLGYERFHGKRIGLADILYVDKNVVMLWKEHPSDKDTALVNGCLK
jgi:hypothetical protein